MAKRSDVVRYALLKWSEVEFYPGPPRRYGHRFVWDFRHGIASGFPICCVLRYAIEETLREPDHLDERGVRFVRGRPRPAVRPLRDPSPTDPYRRRVGRAGELLPRAVRLKTCSYPGCDRPCPVGRPPRCSLHPKRKSRSGSYSRAAAKVRAHATECWICGRPFDDRTIRRSRIMCSRECSEGATRSRTSRLLTGGATVVEVKRSAHGAYASERRGGGGGAQGIVKCQRWAAPPPVIRERQSLHLRGAECS
jgi:hypothetical protein